MALRPKFAKANCSWKLKDVRREMIEVESTIKMSQAPFILSKLRGDCQLPAQSELLLLQGYMMELQRVGFGVVLHLANAASVRASVYISAKSRYLQTCAAAKKAGKVQVILPFKPSGASTSSVELSLLPEHGFIST